MTKKIRLMDETGEEMSVDNKTDETASMDSDIVVRQLMKYLEAIDWKLWEMLKLMKAEKDQEDEEEEKTDA